MDIIKDGLHVYAVSDYKENFYYLTTEYPIIKHNKIETLLPVQLLEQDGKKTIRYEITGVCSFRDWGEKRTIGYKECIHLMDSLRDLLRELEEYMLSLNQISFQKENIYISPDGQFRWIYTTEQTEIQKELEGLFLWMLSIMDYEDKKGMDLLYKVLHDMKKHGMEECFLKNDFMNDKKEQIEISSVYDIETEDPMELYPDENVKTLTVMQTRSDQKKRPLAVWAGIILICGFMLLDIAGVIFLFQCVFRMGINRMVAICFVTCILVFCLLQYILIKLLQFTPSGSHKNDMCKQSDQYCNISDKTLHKEDIMEERNLEPHTQETHSQSYNIFEELEKHWGKNEKSMLLSDQSDGRNPVLFSQGNGEKVKISTCPFYIGSEDGLNQLTLRDGRISRQHAVITRGSELDAYYIEDLESKHGTMVNGRRLDPQLPLVLMNGDEIDFSGEIWRFQWN